MNAEDAGQEGGREMDAAVAEKVMGLPMCDHWLAYTWDNEERVTCWLHRGGECVPSRVHGWFCEHDFKYESGTKGRFFGDGPLPEYFRREDSGECGHFVRAPRYSTDITAAWKVVEAMQNRAGEQWDRFEEAILGGPLPFFARGASDAAEMICRAALAALSPTLEERDG